MNEPTQTIHIAGSALREGILPIGDTDGVCPKCGRPLETSYGLAGGGMGLYEYCPQTGNVVTKALDPDE